MGTKGSFQSFDGATRLVGDGHSLGDLLSAGEVDREEMVASLAGMLQEMPAVRIRPDLYAVLPLFDDLPEDLREALLKILALARV